MLAAARARERSLRIDYEADPLARFTLPERHPEYTSPTPGRAFVTVMEGCDLFCAFCVVPATRGREVSRSARDILDDVALHASEGVVEVTLLGQTVNAYGRPRPGRTSGECSFAELIRRTAETPGIERVRFTSPHPIFVSEDLVRCYAEVPELCPHIHLPVQSGSSRVLHAMNRRHDRGDFLRIVDQLRAARPDIALTTDLVVGFPGETDEDFKETLSLIEEASFVDSFSFKYSSRPGTPAVRRDLQPVEPAVSQARLAELQTLQRALTFRAHRGRVGTRARVLVEGPSRRGGAQQMGRCPYNRVINLVPGSSASPGLFVEVEIVEATPHSLLGQLAEAPGRVELPLA
jgi:tRNA-2-methylthio-N6-dimethylallyladenosine synthase